MEYIEIKAKTVDLAVEAAMQELGVTDPEMLSVEVIVEPVKGFLGMGGQDAVVRVQRRKRSRTRTRNRSRNRDGREAQTEKPKQQAQKPQQKPRESAKNGNTRKENRPKDQNRPVERREKPVSDDRPVLAIDDQTKIVKDFLEGLVAAYGLEGTVTATIEDDVIVADVSGDQTEALVGVRGSVKSAVHELTRTVLQKYGQDSARLRLDIAGYAERRRQALAIYAEQLIGQFGPEGGEIMLEPMSPADRKVIHDVAGSFEGVTSYSEGEPPRRYVVLSKAPAEGSEEE